MATAPDSPPPPSGRVQSIDRAFILLRELSSAPRGSTALELARRTGIDRTTIHRLLKTLIHWGMVSADGSTYVLGPECLLLATAHSSRQNVRRAALPYAMELKEKVLDGRSALVSISVPARDRAIIVERIWTPRTPMNVIIDIGNQFLLDDCASGRAILSTYSDDLCLSTLGKARFSKAKPDLKQVRAAGGFCSTVARFKPGLASLAYPFRGRSEAALGAVVVSGLDLDDQLAVDSPLARHLQRACASISAALQDL